jgi:hypothetical protein
LRKEISLEEFQERSEDIESNRADRVAEIYEQMNDRIVESFENMADKSNEIMKELFTERFEANTGKGLSIFDSFVGNMEAGAALIAVSLGSSFGAMIASGTETLGDYLKTTLISVIDTATAMLSAWFAVAVMKDAATLAATSWWTIGAFAAGMAALQVARGYVSSIGADEGVIGINERYNKQASGRDTIPIWVRKGESVLTPEFTNEHQDLLTHLYGGRSEESYFRQKYIQQNSSYAINPNGELIKTNKALLRAIENGISVNAKNFHNIKIVDKTSNGVKVQNFR